MRVNRSAKSINISAVKKVTRFFRVFDVERVILLKSNTIIV